MFVGKLTEDDIKNKKDPQLDKANEVLLKMIDIQLAQGKHK